MSRGWRHRATTWCRDYQTYIGSKKEGGARHACREATKNTRDAWTTNPIRMTTLQRLISNQPTQAAFTTKSAIIGTSLIAFVIFVSTLQVDINGITHPYTTDVGEIQNAGMVQNR